MKKLTLILTVSLLFLAGCMAPGFHMIGMHSSDHETAAVAPIFKEVIYNEYKFSAEFSTDFQTNQSHYSLEIFNLSSEDLVTDAEARFEVLKISEPQETLFAKPLYPDGLKRFSVSRPIESDRQIVGRFLVYAVEGKQLETPLEISFDFDKIHYKHNHVGENGISEWWYIGAAGMAVMMFLWHIF
ncbi:hypothetical protein MROS_0781 [Melioribacter roseus P3M-2]|uniref:Lipoprotein n=1 Tax=Melioribacter roseus (strain DSM 23840 / JCM 17771 / VKM B-2668 / P3M-2) TaxID=1191523 RepID=I6ZYC4_MELRP|nr:hypothetical protein [Melioribacter roseus]AFN74023.1 hypothetical protein MROS_0781 [Melioribacter roseus P3M-2]